MKQNLQGLYVITDGKHKNTEQLVANVAAAIEGGAQIVQYRDKSNNSDKRKDEALALLSLCQTAHCPLIINDDVDLCSDINADGVHIGIHDSHYQAARNLLGNEKIIGVTCYNRFELAQQAQQQGADYVAFGAFYPSLVKPEAVKAEINLLQRAKSELSLPIVAIGGINSQNGQPLINAGADMLAVISDIFAAENITAAAQRFTPLFDDSRKSLA